MAFGQKLVNMGNFTGSISSGAIIQLNPSRKNTYHAFFLQCRKGAVLATTEEIKTQIGDIEVIINGDQKIKFPSHFFHALFKMRTGVDCPNGYIPILLANDKYATYEQKTASSWGMSDVDSFEMYVHFNAVETTITEVKLIGDFSPIEQPLGLHQCYTYQSGQVLTDGKFDITTLSTFGVDARLQALNIVVPSPIKLSSEYLEINSTQNLRMNIEPTDSQIDNIAFGNLAFPLGHSFRFDSGDDIRTTLPMANISQLRYFSNVSGSTGSEYLTFAFEYLRGYKAG